MDFPWTLFAACSKGRGVVTLGLRIRRTITLPVYVIGLLLDYLSDALDRRRLRTMERICLEPARLCGLPESRAALEEMARNYRAAIDD